MSQRRVATVSRLAGVSAATLTVLALSPALANAESVELSVPAAQAVAPGAVLTVTGKGADPLSGYYVATCLVGSTSPKGPECLGDRAAPGIQQWVSNAPGATKPLGPDGSFSVELTGVTAGTTTDGKQVDCAVAKCAVTVFHDHRNGFDTVSELPITVAAATAAGSPAPNSPAPNSPAPNSPAPAAASTDAAAAKSSTSVTRWVIGGALVLVVLAGVVVLARSRRRTLGS